MEIGKPRRVHKVEPLHEPVPRETPVRPAEAPKTPEKLPAK
jgi:hypothetical protein